MNVHIKRRIKNTHSNSCNVLNVISTTAIFSFHLFSFEDETPKTIISYYSIKRNSKSLKIIVQLLYLELQDIWWVKQKNNLFFFCLLNVAIYYTVKNKVITLTRNDNFLGKCCFHEAAAFYRTISSSVLIKFLSWSHDSKTSITCE